MGSKNSAWDIVNDSPYASNWYTTSLEPTADQELVYNGSLVRLRQSSRKLIKNNPVASAAQLAYISMILGGTVNIEAVTDNERLKKEVEKLFEDNVDKVDINRLKSITQMNDMCIGSSFMDGDVLWVVPIDKDIPEDKIQTYLEPIEASRVKTRRKDQSNPLIREGVEYYKNGKIKGYWVVNSENKSKYVNYLNANDEDFKFYPVRNTSKDGKLTRRVAYNFEAVTSVRPEQSRQTPVLTPLMEFLRYYGQMMEAILVGVRVAACFSGFITTTNPTEALKGMGTLTDGSGRKITKLNPGTMSYLRPGESVEFASPNRPADNFDSFVLRLDRMISMALRIPYEIFYLNLSDTNYSSQRGGMIEMERTISRWRRELEKFNLWWAWTIVSEAVSKGMLNGSIRNLKLRVKFPKYKALDEEKTARADKIKLANKTSSEKQIVVEQGNDWDDLQKELTDEQEIKIRREAEGLRLRKELEEELGIKFPTSEKDEEGKRDTSDSRREGEDTGADLDEDDAKERKKTDGNN